MLEAGGAYAIYRCKNSACEVRVISSSSLKSHFYIQVTVFLVYTYTYLMLLSSKKKIGLEAENIDLYGYV